MDDKEKTITTFATRVRQLIFQYQDLEKENAGLYAMVDERDALIKQLEGKLSQVQRDYDLLKMAKMIEVSDGDLEGAKKRVAKLVRDVNKCITLLSENNRK